MKLLRLKKNGKIIMNLMENDIPVSGFAFGKAYGNEFVNLTEKNMKNENLNLNETPADVKPVLAKIEHINSLGKSSWYEVVYFDEHWRCYAGSDTFKDGEKVVKWRYCKDCS